MKKKWLQALLAAGGVMLLILDSETAIYGAKDGITLCLQVIIPSLFPFFVLINLLNSALMASDTKWLSPFERLLRLPQGSGSIWLCGILGGYPSGAQLIHSAWKQRALKEEAANRMLRFCSNAGPAFLFGIIASQFERTIVIWWIWAIHIVSSFVVAWLSPWNDPPVSNKKNSTPLTFNDALKKSLVVTGQVCGWIILFRIAVSFCSKWFLWLLPDETATLLICLLELANGASFLRSIENEGMRMLIATIGVNFGGVCVLMQTASVVDGLKLRNYLAGKMMQTFVGIVLSLPLQKVLFAPCDRALTSPLWIVCPLSALVICVYFQQKRKITVAFRRNPLYNLLNDKRKG